MSDQFITITELNVRSPEPTSAQNEVSLISFDLLASLTLELPGLRASIEKLGLSVDFSLRLDRKGKAGLIDYKITAREPRGMGAELLLPPISGSGYLEKVGTKQLRGAFGASLGVIQVKALGVLDIDEFSMVALLAGEFTPPLQLSFGFTLVGVGGLVGINRRIDEREITAAASSGNLSHLLFPRDPVTEAPRLLELLDRCFPREKGGMIIGPMVKVGWGTPTMVSATLAVLISTADAKTVILGRLAITLPFEAAPLINIEAFIKGDIDQYGLRIDATLTNSRIGIIPVDGELRLRLVTIPKPLFALAVGGFYPGYPVPDGMAGMRRLSAVLSPSPILHIRLEAYAAITTSSVQFGARLELTIGFDGYGIHGFAQFDAFMTWEPSFGFATTLTASVSVECADFDVGSITLNGRLAGPAKWRFHGSASFSILWWDIDINLPEIEWGEDPGTPIPARDPLADLVYELNRSENWTAASATVPQIVSLRHGTGSDTVIHPLGVVGFRQRVVPVNTPMDIPTPIERYGGSLLPHPVTMSVEPDGAQDDKHAFVSQREDFVPSQFLVQDDNARLTQTGYVRLPAGFDIVPTDTSIPRGTVRNLHYEVKQLRKEPDIESSSLVALLLSDAIVDASKLIAGVSDRYSFEPDLLVKNHDIHETVRAASTSFMNAAGRPLEQIRAWEVQTYEL